MVIKGTRLVPFVCSFILFFKSFLFSQGDHYNNYTIDLQNNSSHIEDIITTVLPFSSAIAIVKSIIGSSEANNNFSDNTWQLISQGGSTFESTLNCYEAGLSEKDFQKLETAYFKLRDYEKKCAPFYVDRFRGIHFRSAEEIIKTFCAESTKYFKDANWSTINSSLATLSNLRKRIRTRYKFRKRRIRSLEKAFNKKGYIDDVIAYYEAELRNQLASERQQRKQQEAQKAAKLAEQAKPKPTPEQILQTRLEEIQNYKEIIEACRSKQANLAEVALRQALFCEQELLHGITNQRYHTYKARLEAIIKTMQRPEKTVSRSYKIDKSLKKQAPSWGLNLDRLGEMSGNQVQHSRYKEAVAHLHNGAHLRTNFFDITNIDNMTNIIMQSADCAITHGEVKAYQSGFDFLDLAHKVCSVTKDVITGMAYLGERTMEGVDLASKDLFSRLIPESLSHCIHCENGAAQSCCPTCSPDTFDYDKFFEVRSEEIGDNINEFFTSCSNFIQRAKAEPLHVAGDIASFSSRTLTNVSFYGVLYFSLIQPLATGAVAVGGTIATVAKEMFGPEFVSVIGGGAATAQVSPGLVGVVEGATAVAGAVGQAVSAVGPAGQRLGEVVGASLMGGGDGKSENICEYEDIASYISKNGKLPAKYIKKEDAIKLGWTPRRGNLHKIAPGKSIGGNLFENKANNTNGIKLLPDTPERIWYEADIGYTGGYRGSNRILYSNDGLIYKTSDHYKTAIRIK